MANRLSSEPSPYLQQHADQPVDWWPWCEEAFAEARRRDVPILLSIGYAACHWCHVMSEESFEDSVTARYLNENFVSIKVDREERPDIDSVYMTATTAMAGQGGWPMTCILDHSGAPFFAGTYFPPEPRHGLPAFTQVLQAITDAWTSRRDELLAVGSQVAEHLTTGMTTGASTVGTAELDDVLATLSRDFDQRNGGFGTSPKFPPSMVLAFLQRYAHRTGSGDALMMIETTLEAMARGGIYDQLDGGFARYSVDAQWLVPHFEKMLDDNAQLLAVYTRWWLDSRSELARRVAIDTADFLLRRMRTPDGGFATSLDADTEGQEGAHYVWTPAQLVEALGHDDGRWAAGIFAVSAEGNFEDGASTLLLPAEPDDLARFHDVQRRLQEHRRSRPVPLRDDKVLTGPVAMTASALIAAGLAFERPEFTEAGLAATRFLWDIHGGPKLLRMSRDGVTKEHRGSLADHALMIDACLACGGVETPELWVARAEQIADSLAEFDDGKGTFYDTSDEAETLIVRPQDFTDNAAPSGNAAACRALIRLAAATGKDAYRQRATAIIERLSTLMRQAPRFAGWSLTAAEELVTGPPEVAVVGEPGGLMHRRAVEVCGPSAVVIAGPTGTPLALFEGKGRIDGQETAWICRRFVCRQPITDPAALAEVMLQL